MNIFAGTGKIIDVNLNSKVLKFNLANEQGKPCLIPCVLFDTSDEVRNFIEQLQTSGQVVWLQGRVSSYEYEYNGKTIRKIQVISNASIIKTI
ncbi:single-stranded DNA-binding protein [Patescibacteria group bacterium]|nr:single-stranded DNA-binding protein [Patescibacteria group bacterium]MBU4311063.1 single-stranded DNA-binding protein [bacterium]